MSSQTPYNPLDYANLARSLELALKDGGWHPLPPVARFVGAGVYALYYFGDFAAYRPLVEHGEIPIYIGRGTPRGSRKGDPDATAGAALWERLKIHVQSIDEATNLDLQDFRCRYLVTEPIWVYFAERCLISRYRPLWNGVIDGFGNKAQGKARTGGRRSKWDTLHPGRDWPRTREATIEVTEIESLIASHLRALSLIDGSA